MPGPGENGSALRRQPVELTINRRMTGGLDRDRTGGDEGVLVLVEPRDDEGRLVRSPAPFRSSSWIPPKPEKPRGWPVGTSKPTSSTNTSKSRRLAKGWCTSSSGRASRRPIAI